MRKILLVISFFVFYANNAICQTVVKLALPNNCEQQTDVIDVESPKNSKLELFPNPNEGTFTVDLNFKSNIDFATIYVLNTLGENVYFESLFCNSNRLVKQLYLINIARGTYVLTIRNEKESIYTKLIIQ